MHFFLPNYQRLSVAARKRYAGSEEEDGHDHEKEHAHDSEEDGRE
jgi:hypothetical protein